MSLAAVVVALLFAIGILFDVGIGVLLCVVVCIASLKKSSPRRALLMAGTGAASFFIPLLLWSRFGISMSDPLFKFFIAPLVCGGIGFLFGLTRLVVTLMEGKRAAISVFDR